jgi:hypothetical protein
MSLFDCSVRDIEALQQEVSRWYAAFQEATRMRIKHLVDAHETTQHQPHR